MNVEKRIEQLYGPLPQAPSPVAAYVPVVQSGNLMFLSGQGPIINGEPEIHRTRRRGCVDGAGL